jgi:hypothetical protein
MNGTVKAKKPRQLIGFTPHATPENSLQKLPPAHNTLSWRYAIAPTAHHRPGRTHAHFAVELLQVRYIKKPMIAANARLRHHSRKITPAIERSGNNLEKGAPRIAGPIIAARMSNMNKPAARGTEGGAPDGIIEEFRIPSIDHPARNRGIAVDPAIAQKRPIPADVFERLQINFAHQNLLFVMRSLGNHSAEGIT